jgi:hypothetical protein
LKSPLIILDFYFKTLKIFKLPNRFSKNKPISLAFTKNGQTGPIFNRFFKSMVRHNGIANNLFQIWLPPTALPFLANLLLWTLVLGVVMGP